MVIKGFLNSVILIVERRPLFRIVKEIEKLLIKNAASMQIEIDSKNHRYLSLICLLIRYNTITGYNFILYINPRALPIFPDNPT